MSGRVLILVLSSHVPPYDQLHEAQRRTWDSVAVECVTTQYYFCETWDNHTPFGPALDRALGEPWTHLFRTNSSSYVCKRRLLSFCENLPAARCYCGIPGTFRGIPYVSGSGAILSRDAVLVLREALKRPSPFPGSCEDVFMGLAITGAGIPITPGAERFDYFAKERRGPLPDVYHYRCKGEGPGGQRLDAQAFSEIHRMKCEKE